MIIDSWVLFQHAKAKQPDDIAKDSNTHVHIEYIHMHLCVCTAAKFGTQKRKNYQLSHAFFMPRCHHQWWHQTFPTKQETSASKWKNYLLKKWQINTEEEINWFKECWYLFAILHQFGRRYWRPIIINYEW